MAWLNLTIPKQTVKAELKAKKIKLTQMNFFIKKQLIKFSCTYQSLYILPYFTKVPELWRCAIFGPKMTIYHEQKFFGTNHYYYCHLPIGPFRCAKFKKITVDPELWGCAILGPKMVNLPPIFFWKIINIILIYLLALFIVQNLKKLLQWIQSYEDAHFLGPKLPISANENFSRKAITEPCFMPIYMPKIKVRY